MSLLQLVDNTRTDKNTNHSYLDVYEFLMTRMKNRAQNVLEVGIYLGGSIKLWHDYFPNAVIQGLDCIPIEEVWDAIKGNPRIRLHTSIDAYNPDFFKKEFLDKSVRFDIVIDDGPHTLESMVQFIRLYSQILTDDGILIIEDIQCWDWISILRKEVPSALLPYVSVYDLRYRKGRWDDILFVINKRAI